MGITKGGESAHGAGSGHKEGWGVGIGKGGEWA